MTDLPPLPHTGTALLLTAVVRSDSNSIEAIGLVPVAHPLVSGGRAPAILGLELGAQAAAAMEAITRASSATGRPARVGYVVRVREARFAQPDLPVETPVQITARLEGAAPPLAVYRIRVAVAGVESLWAVLSTLSGPAMGVDR